MSSKIKCTDCRFNWKDYYCGVWNCVIDPVNHPDKGCLPEVREKQVAASIKSRPTTLEHLTIDRSKS